MYEDLPSLPDAPRLFEGSDAERFLALSLEALIQDVSLSGDREAAVAVADYLLGDGDPPDEAAFVERTDAGVRLSDPPFLHAEVEVRSDPPGLRVAFDSDLELLVDPPVVVEYDGPIHEAVAALEQTIAEIYRTRGRHLEGLGQ